MIGGIQLKVCGLTSPVDADVADRSGADFLGFILHPASPRHITLKQFRSMAPRLPGRHKVRQRGGEPPLPLVPLRRAPLRVERPVETPGLQLVAQHVAEQLVIAVRIVARPDHE